MAYIRFAQYANAACRYASLHSRGCGIHSLRSVCQRRLSLRFAPLTRLWHTFASLSMPTPLVVTLRSTHAAVAYIRFAQYANAACRYASLHLTRLWHTFASLSMPTPLVVTLRSTHAAVAYIRFAEYATPLVVRFAPLTRLWHTFASLSMPTPLVVRFAPLKRLWHTFASLSMPTPLVVTLRSTHAAVAYIRFAQYANAACSYASLHSRGCGIHSLSLRSVMPTPACRYASLHSRGCGIHSLRSVCQRRL